MRRQWWLWAAIFTGRPWSGAFIPTIVLGAIAGPFTLGIGFAVMAAGIVGTSLSGAAMIVSICAPIL